MVLDLCECIVCVMNVSCVNVSANGSRCRRINDWAKQPICKKSSAQIESLLFNIVESVEIESIFSQFQGEFYTENNGGLNCEIYLSNLG